MEDFFLVLHFSNSCYTYMLHSVQFDQMICQPDYDSATWPLFCKEQNTTFSISFLGILKYAFCPRTAVLNRGYLVIKFRKPNNSNRIKIDICIPIGVCWPLGIRTSIILPGKQCNVDTNTQYGPQWLGFEKPWILIPTHIDGVCYTLCSDIFGIEWGFEGVIAQWPISPEPDVQSTNH